MKKILVACGAGVATSTVVAKKIEEELGRRGLAVRVEQCKATEVESRAPGYDLIVSTTPVPDVGIPSLRTLSFLTGMGIEEDLDRIAKLLGG